MLACNAATIERAETFDTHAETGGPRTPETMLCVPSQVLGQHPAVSAHRYNLDTAHYPSKTVLIELQLNADVLCR